MRWDRKSSRITGHFFANQGNAEQLHSDGILNNPGFHNNIQLVHLHDLLKPKC